MASFEPILIVFGSSKSMSTINLRLPISFVFAINEESLECLVTIDPQSFDRCLQRYFVILLDSITDELLDRLQTNHHIQRIYSRNAFMNVSNERKLHRIINKQWQQFTCDLTADIVHFLTVEGEKQASLEQIPLAQVYYRQARLLKEWAMSFMKAEPCHILLIPLNSSQENIDNAYEQLQKICTKLGYPSVIIQTLDKYIPIDNVEKPHLIPYAEALFNNEHPHYICELIKKLSPLRFYLYGNEYFISSEWSNLMITRETDLMEDEDNWCAFLENEFLDNDMKWNFRSMFGEKWQIKRIAPMNLIDLDKNLRFQSALRRAFKTFHQRQIEITAEIFERFDRCIRHGYLQLEPKLTIQQEEKITRGKVEAETTLAKCRFRSLSTFPSRPSLNAKGISFIWLDELLHHSEDYLNEIIKPLKWCFFNDISICIPYIENELRKENKIFLVVSGSFGYQLFLTSFHLMPLIPFVYIYCSRVDLHIDWINNHHQIQGSFNDSIKLGEQIKNDLNQLYRLGFIHQYSFSNTNHGEPSTTSLPLIVYNQEQVHLFLAHQRTIDTLLCMPHTTESRDEMLIECRRIYKENELALLEIDEFDKIYHSNAALQWYSRDSFVFRIINQALRSSNVNTMFKMRYFLTDLYAQLNELYKQRNIFNLYEEQQIEKVYRGQHMSKIEFEYFQNIQGNIISFNTFLSTTKSLQIALCFANTSIENNDFIPVIFCIEINRCSESIRPYGNISKLSMFNDEEEVLFSMGSIFRVQSIEILDKKNHIPVIYLTLIDQNEFEKNFNNN